MFLICYYPQFLLKAPEVAKMWDALIYLLIYIHHNSLFYSRSIPSKQKCVCVHIFIGFCAPGHIK